MSLLSTVDVDDLRAEIRATYDRVAREPDAEFHFEMGRALAARIGYPAEDLDAVPPDALASFAGVGHALDLAALAPGDRVVDLGCGSGTDVFAAARRVGPEGRVVGIDMTPGQLAKARALRDAACLPHVAFEHAQIESLPLRARWADVVISNGVVNLVPDKGAVFAEAARVLRPGGRLALADIVSNREIKPTTRAKADLWAACVAGAIVREDYLALIEGAGLRVEQVRRNPEYRFISERAQSTCAKYGVEVIEVLAVKP
ncbi:MAG: methyltransferase domain-containing protein [Solirubrobacteraceae bacterium]|nr:methyltransferase domain-containing protein [Solirubrobacteraceae bacterium]